MPARKAAVEAMTMMLPERCGMKQRLATAWLSANTLDALSVMTLFQASRGCSSALAPHVPQALRDLQSQAPRAAGDQRHPSAEFEQVPQSHSDDLEQARRALPAADAHGDHHELGAPALALDQCVPREPRAADAQEIVRNTQLGAAVKHLDGKRFVQLPQVDVADLDAGAFEQARYRIQGADAHFVGLATGHREAAENAQRLQTALLGEFGVHHHTGAAAVGELTGIARGDHTARHGGANLRDPFQRG